MNIDNLDKIYRRAKEIGITTSSRDFCREYLMKYPDYIGDNAERDCMVQPWTLATLLGCLRKLRDVVGARCRPDIETIIADVEHGLAVATRYRYR